jgi:sortase A
MNQNPLFPSDDDQQGQHRRSDHGGFVLPRNDYNVAPPDRADDPAVNAIRDKLAKLYASEPDTLQEEQQAEAAKHRSKHQQFMHELHNSGKDLAQIQTEWHNYYINLPDNEKHSVWQEFYASNQSAAQSTVSLPAATPTHTEALAQVRTESAGHSNKAKQARHDRRETSEVQHDIREHAGRRRLTKKQHLHSLLFGLTSGIVALVIFSFGFFNEVIIAPFIQPGKASAETPLIVSTDTVAPSNEAQVIIPKINVQIPIQFDINATDEATMQKELESGVAHYPTTSQPGQNGNAAYFGHSSNNIFNKGKYKFAFVLLHELVPGDTFHITKDGKLYTYKVFDKKIVEPNQIEVLDPIAGHPATATLITCDPPGTSLRRLVIVGDQINPDPSGNSAASTELPTEQTANTLSGNSPTLWGNFIGSAGGKVVAALLVLGSLVVIFRRLSRSKQL